MPLFTTQDHCSMSYQQPSNTGPVYGLLTCCDKHPCPSSFHPPSGLSRPYEKQRKARRVGNSTFNLNPPVDALESRRAEVPFSVKATSRLFCCCRENRAQFSSSRKGIVHIGTVTKKRGPTNLGSFVKTLFLPTVWLSSSSSCLVGSKR